MGIRRSVNARKSIQIQLELECVRVNEGGLLERIPCPSPDDINLLYVYQDGDDYFVYFRHDVGSEIQEQIRNLSAEIIFHDKPTIKKILSQVFSNVTINMFQTYNCAHNLKHNEFSDVVTIEKDGKSIFAILRNEKIVSSCLSVRENAHAAECYIFTEPEFRRCGYARKTVVAWVDHIQSLGKIPFYSHEHGNLASRVVANKLGLVPCFDVVTYGHESSSNG